GSLVIFESFLHLSCLAVDQGPCAVPQQLVLLRHKAYTSAPAQIADLDGPSLERIQKYLYPFGVLHQGINGPVPEFGRKRTPMQHPIIRYSFVRNPAKGV